MRTIQELCDHGVKSLLKQKQKSAFGSMCKYRQDESASCEIKCFIGHLIPDEKYLPTMEFYGSNSVIALFPHLLDEFIQLNEFETTILAEMQLVHDDIDVGDWEEKFKEKYDEFGLKWIYDGESNV